MESKGRKRIKKKQCSYHRNNKRMCLEEKPNGRCTYYSGLFGTNIYNPFSSIERGSCYVSQNFLDEKLLPMCTILDTTEDTNTLKLILKDLMEEGIVNLTRSEINKMDKRQLCLETVAAAIVRAKLTKTGGVSKENLYKMGFNHSDVDRLLKETKNLIIQKGTNPSIVWSELNQKIQNIEPRLKQRPGLITLITLLLLSISKVGAFTVEDLKYDPLSTVHPSVPELYKELHKELRKEFIEIGAKDLSDTIINYEIFSKQKNIFKDFQHHILKTPDIPFNLKNKDIKEDIRLFIFLGSMAFNKFASDEAVHIARYQYFSIARQLFGETRSDMEKIAENIKKISKETYDIYIQLYVTFRDSLDKIDLDDIIRMPQLIDERHFLALTSKRYITQKYNNILVPFWIEYLDLQNRIGTIEGITIEYYLTNDFGEYGIRNRNHYVDTWKKLIQNSLKDKKLEATAQVFSIMRTKDYINIDENPTHDISEKIYFTGHANALWIDHKNKIITRFEPHGVITMNFDEKVSKIIDMILYDVSKQLSFRYISPVEFYKTTVIGPQFIEGDNPADTGNCILWSNFYLHFRLSTIDDPSRDFVKEFLKIEDLETSPISSISVANLYSEKQRQLRTIIRNYNIYIQWILSGIKHT